MNINKLMETEIKDILKIATRFYLKNRRGRAFLTSFVMNAGKKARVRNKWADRGTQIPPFLIASVASQCNLCCSGCYARAGGTCHDMAEKTEDLTTREWEAIFSEADSLGISFIMLAGGEPYMRPDVLQLASRYKDIIFPVFTNGTLLNENAVAMLDKNRNLIPVISAEGDKIATDSRRGTGTYNKIKKAMSLLQEKKLLFGTSITVTKDNLKEVTEEGFIAKLRKDGCALVFYVEYVPVDESTEELVLDKDDLKQLEKRVNEARSLFDNMIVISFPGDEEMMGGCLAAGRGFFHINSTGGAEPCPFSPYSNMNLKENSMIEILSSAFFEELRTMNHDAEHEGGCTLFNKREQVESLLV